MLTQVHPKLPMRKKSETLRFYEKLGFQIYGSADYEFYLMIQMDNIEIHFFQYSDLDPKENYGQVYIRTDTIENLYHSFNSKNVTIHPNGKLEMKAWGLKEFSILDPNNNLLTFGEHLQ